MAAPAPNLKDDELEELIFKPVRAQLRQPGSSVMDFPKSFFSLPTICIHLSIIFPRVFPWLFKIGMLVYLSRRCPLPSYELVISSLTIDI